MFQHKESDFVIPVLKTISSSGGKCTTEYVKRNVHQFIELTEKDMTPYPSRNPNEPRYYQVVGNLISHRNTTLFTYMDISFNDEGKSLSHGLLVINEKGKEFLKSLDAKTLHEDEVDTETDSAVIEDEIDTETGMTATEENVETESDFTITDPFDEKIMTYAMQHGLDKRPPTDSKIANTVIELTGYKCEYAVSIGKKHNLFIGKSKHPFMEGHHLVPMKAAKDFFPLNLDRPSNIVPLCPGCHALLHHASKDEREKVLKVLYENHIEQLNVDGIYISFEKLLTKYYL